MGPQREIGRSKPSSGKLMGETQFRYIYEALCIFHKMPIRIKTITI
jgi:hypothetical protein